MAAVDSTRLGGKLIKAKVLKRDAPKALGFVERTTLFVVALKRSSSIGLLEGFASEERRLARALAQRLVDLDSPTRQARLTAEFSVRADAKERVERLLADAPPALRAALEPLVPASWQRTSPRPDPAASPALRTLAARLVAEAMR